MANNNEEKINKFLDFPYDAFLMVRLEYVQILEDELEAKLLRIIEKYIDMERKRIYREMINAAPANNGQVVEVTKDIWVPISYRLFMNDLFGTVTSENTVKKALKDMIKKKIIFQRFQPKKKYDAPEYKIHVNPLQTLLSMLPNPEYQKLIPSFIDTLKDLPPQELTPSECQKLIPLAALRVSKIDTNITEVTNNNREVITEESNSDDTTKHTIVSSDTARTFSSSGEIDEAMIREIIAESSLSSEGEVTEEFIQQTIDIFKHRVLVELRARPGLSEHPDDQLPGKTEEFLEKLREWRIEDEQALPSQDEEVFTDDEPQGDDHAVPAASGHSHRIDDATPSGDNPSHTAVDSGQVAAPEDRPVLETQEIDDKGEHHASRVPIVPAANPATSGKRHVSRPGSDHSDHGAHPDNGLPVVRPVGSVTASGVGSREADIQRPVGKDRTAQTLAETPTTPMPAQSLSLPPQAEQAASGMTFVEARDYLRSLGYFLEPVPAMNGNWEIREPGERGFSVISGDEVRGIAEYQRKKREQAAPGQSPKGKGKGKKQAEPKPETPKGPPVAPPADMAWGTRKCLMWFDFWRGGILIGKWKLMQASTCAKGLAEQFDEQTVIQARTDMEADPYYIDKGGCDVCDVANNIHKYLKRRQGKQQPAIQPALKVVKRYSSYDDPNFRSDQDFYPVEGGSYATASR